MESAEAVGEKRNSIDSKTWVPIGAVSAVIAVVLALAVGLAADRAAVVRASDDNARTLMRHEDEIRALRRDLTESTVFIRSALGRIEGKLDRSPPAP